MRSSSPLGQRRSTAAIVYIKARGQFRQFQAQGATTGRGLLLQARGQVQDQSSVSGSRQREERDWGGWCIPRLVTKDRFAWGGRCIPRLVHKC